MASIYVRSETRMKELLVSRTQDSRDNYLDYKEEINGKLQAESFLTMV